MPSTAYRLSPIAFIFTMSEKTPKVIIVMPAYNASKTLSFTLKDIPEGVADDILLVDDASSDNTVSIARQLRISVMTHPVNRGYGANQKTCYTEALKRGANIVVMLHPDYQYDPQVIPQMVKHIAEGKTDVVFASRFLLHDPRKAGMPLYKFLANRFLTWIENRVLDTHYSELHTGYRAYSRKLLQSIAFLQNSNDFVFDTEIILQLTRKGYNIYEIPVETRYREDSSSVGVKTGTVYGLKTLLSLWKYLLEKWGIKHFSIFE